MTFENIQSWIQSYGLIVLFIGNILDHSGIPVFIIVAGGIVALGLQPIEPVLVVSIVSILTGDILFYLIGRYFDRDRFIDFLGFRIAKESVIKFEINIIEKPITFIIFGRLIAILGKYVPLILGLNKFSIRNFIIVDLLGSLLYMSIFLIIGFYGSNLLSSEIQLIQKIFIFFTFILLFYLFNKTSINSADKNFGIRPKKSFLGSVKSYNKDEKIRPSTTPPDG